MIRSDPVQLDEEVSTEVGSKLDSKSIVQALNLVLSCGLISNCSGILFIILGNDLLNLPWPFKSGHHQLQFISKTSEIVLQLSLYIKQCREFFSPDNVFMGTTSHCASNYSLWESAMDIYSHHPLMIVAVEFSQESSSYSVFSIRTKRITPQYYSASDYN